MKKCVITVVGKDTVGIIAKVCELLSVLPFTVREKKYLKKCTDYKQIKNIYGKAGKTHDKQI